MVALRVASVEVIKKGMLCTFAVPAIKANLHGPLASFYGVVIVVFLTDDFLKEESSFVDNCMLNLDLILSNPKTVTIDLIVNFHMEASLNTPTNHMTIITQDNTIKHDR